MSPRMLVFYFAEIVEVKEKGRRVRRGDLIEARVPTTGLRARSSNTYTAGIRGLDRRTLGQTECTWPSGARARPTRLAACAVGYNACGWAMHSSLAALCDASHVRPGSVCQAYCKARTRPGVGSVRNCSSMRCCRLAEECTLPEICNKIDSFGSLNRRRAKLHCPIGAL
ncbi:hypothetical protein KSP39_PZI006004 [Platanthera zijinensis]|uniref:Uncharacterized protein n=1 Tax=Platanthera zijinensis TaxID=2320716 RepID=A0AAP0BSA7_9ASPA